VQTGLEREFTARVDEAVFRRLALARKHAWTAGMVLARPRSPAA